MRKMLTLPVLLFVVHKICGETTTRWGSSVVVKPNGPSPLLRYETAYEPDLNLDRKQMLIKEGACYVNGMEVGRPCSVTKTDSNYVTEITLLNVTAHKQLWVAEDVKHTTFFAPNCVFEKPVAGQVIVTPSLPLFRLMKGKQEVHMTFAQFVGSSRFQTELYQDFDKICAWDGLMRTDGNANFCQLQLRNGDSEVWFNGIFYKGDEDRSTIEFLVTSRNAVAVSVDWSQSGSASENEVCLDESKTPSESTDDKLDAIPEGAIDQSKTPSESTDDKLEAIPEGMIDESKTPSESTDDKLEAIPEGAIDQSKTPSESTDEKLEAIPEGAIDQSKTPSESTDDKLEAIPEGAIDQSKTPSESTDDKLEAIPEGAIDESKTPSESTDDKLEAIPEGAIDESKTPSESTDDKLEAIPEGAIDKNAMDASSANGITEAIPLDENGVPR